MTFSWQPQWAHTDVEWLESTERLSGFFVVKEWKLRFRLFNGNWSPIIQRNLLYRPNAAAVLLYDPETDEVVLIEQLRMGACYEVESPWMLEIVGGMIEAGDTAIATAHREAVEESGCTISELIPICEYLASAGISVEKTSVYCGKVVAKSAGDIQGLLHEGEDIKVHVMSALSAFELLKIGRINSASTVIALQWLQLNRHTF